ncbi:MAG: leucine-rich repeat domain-containing protein [Candidatus Zhuqueibacterota bacterium]
MKIVKVVTSVLLLCALATGALAQSKTYTPDPWIQKYHQTISALKNEINPALRKTTGATVTVVFPDANLEAAVRDALEIPTAPITDADMLMLATLVANDENISNLTGLEYALNLSILSLRENNISDLSPLQNLTSMSYLFVDNNYVLTSIQPIANMRNLLYLGFGNNAITDISVLQNINYIIDLNLNNNQITDISPLRNQRQLDVLVAGNNNIEDISALANVRSLTTLYLQGNEISDISPLANLTNLLDLYIPSNQISDMSAVANMTELVSLSIHTNQISDLSPVENLTALSVLVINDNSISDLSPIQGLTNLSTLYLGNNNISDASPASGLVNLTGLKMEGNLLNNDDLLSFYDLDALAGLDLSNNPDITSGTAMQALGDNLDSMNCEDIVWDGQCGIDPPVPVELSAFNAHIQAGKIVLQWATESETNSFGFDIEKSRDGETFERIGFVQGQGTTSTPSRYEFIDQSVVAGANYYRLRQVDFDGQFEYSDIIDVVVGAPTRFKLGQNFPNPFNSSTMISFALPERAHVEITVFDITGKTLAVVTNQTFEAGSYNVHFNASSLPSGSYFYKMVAGQYSSVQKLVVLK